MARATTKTDLLLTANGQHDKLWKLIDSMTEETQNATFDSSMAAMGKEAHWDLNLSDKIDEPLLLQMRPGNFSTCRGNFSMHRENFSTHRGNFSTCRENFSTCRENFGNEWQKEKLQVKHIDL
jgi:hypothetical protein